MNNYFYLIEGDHRVMGQDAVDKKLAELVRVTPPVPTFIILIDVASHSANKTKKSTRRYSTYLPRFSVDQKHLQGLGHPISALLTLLKEKPYLCTL